MPTRPGVNPNFIWEHFSKDEISVIQTISKNFYVTTSGQINSGNSKHRYL